MAENKKSFIAYSDWYGTFSSLPDDIAGRLIKHVFSYVNDENPVTDDFVVKALFEQIKSTLKRDLQKWEGQREQRKLAGAKSAEQRANKSNDRSTESNDRSISLNEIQRNPTVSVNVNGNVKKDIEERLKSFQLKLESFIPEYGEVMVKEFYNYWREKNESGTKMRFESEKVFDLNLRLKRWYNNQSKFSKNTNKPVAEMVATADGGLIDKNELNRIFKE